MSVLRVVVVVVVVLGVVEWLLQAVENSSPGAALPAGVAFSQ
jgi:hypothetical protein